MSVKILKEFRETNGISREEQAEILRVTIETLNNWEYRKKEIPKSKQTYVKKTLNTYINNTSPEKNDNKSDQNIEKIVDLIFENLSEFESNERFSKYILLKNKDAIIKYQEELLAKANVTNSSDKK